MELRAAGTRIRVHPLMLLLPLLALRLHPGAAAGATALSLALHEAAHLAAARGMGVRVESLLLMPFGGQAVLGNLYALSPIQLFTVAAAGPAANLGLTLVAAALCQWGVIDPLRAGLFQRINLALMLFNLLPALPLDGGRMLYALTARQLGRARAAALGIRMGWATAAVLLLFALRGLHESGRFNLSLAACAVFLLASGPEERRALSDLRAASPLNALRDHRVPIGLTLCAVAADCPALDALRHAAPDAATLYAVYRGDRLAAFVDERALLNRAIEDPEASVASAMEGAEFPV